MFFFVFLSLLWYVYTRYVFVFSVVFFSCIAPQAKPLTDDKDCWGPSFVSRLRIYMRDTVRLCQEGPGAAKGSIRTGQARVVLCMSSGIYSIPGMPVLVFIALYGDVSFVCAHARTTVENVENEGDRARLTIRKRQESRNEKYFFIFFLHTPPRLSA